VQALIGHSLGALAIVCARPHKAPAWFGALQKVVLISVPSGAPFLIQAFHRMFGIGAATDRYFQACFRRRFGTEPASFTARPDDALRRLPVLVVHDREDDIVPFEHGEAVLTTLGNARLLATEGLGHSALTRDSATIHSIGEFLDRTVA